MREHARTFASVPFEERDWHVIAMCNACGQNTGNYCDVCEQEGRTYVTALDEAMVGSPLCIATEPSGELSKLRWVEGERDVHASVSFILEDLSVADPYHESSHPHLRPQAFVPSTARDTNQARLCPV